MTADGLQFIVCFLNAVNTDSFITSDRKGCNGDIKSRRLQSKVKNWSISSSRYYI